TMVRLGLSGLQIRRSGSPCSAYQGVIDIDGAKVGVSTGVDEIGEYEAAGVILKEPDVFWRLAWLLWRSASSNNAITISDVKD
ncbi:MAG: hypothetical protein ACR2PZ_26360, partial [Pseudomonadales bacterium]